MFIRGTEGFLKELSGVAVLTTLAYAMLTFFWFARPLLVCVNH